MIVTKSSITNNRFYKYGYEKFMNTLRPVIRNKPCFRKFINDNLAVEVDIETREIKAFKNKRTYWGRQWTELKTVKPKWVKDIQHLMIMDAVFDEK